MKRYAAFAGPRLPTVISSHGNVALIGDASHPLSGAFGAGAGFALEDAYALSQSLSWAYSQSPHSFISKGLELFDQKRSPHYERLYGVLDRFQVINETLDDPNINLNSDEEVAVLVSTNWARRHNWIYDYDITAEFANLIARESTTRKDPSIQPAKL